MREVRFDSNRTDFAAERKVPVTTDDCSARDILIIGYVDGKSNDEREERFVTGPRGLPMASLAERSRTDSALPARPVNPPRPTLAVTASRARALDLETNAPCSRTASRPRWRRTPLPCRPLVVTSTSRRPCSLQNVWDRRLRYLKPKLFLK